MCHFFLPAEHGEKLHSLTEGLGIACICKGLLCATPRSTLLFYIQERADEETGRQALDSGGQNLFLKPALAEFSPSAQQR